MVTIYRERGLCSAIYTDDHDPAHVHVIGDGKAKIDLVSEDGKPQLVHNDGLEAGDLRKALRIVAEQQAMMLERWDDYHG